MAVRFDLHDDWTLYPVRPEGAAAPDGAALVPDTGVPASVPGCVHTDLLAADLIDDPYIDDNEDRLGWIGRTDWRY